MIDMNTNDIVAQKIEKIERKRKIIGLSGILLMLISAILFMGKVTFGKLEIRINITGSESPLNLTILIWVVLFIIGAVSATRLVANGTESENFRNATLISFTLAHTEKILFHKFRKEIEIKTSEKIYNIPWSRLAAALIMGGVSMWNLISFGSEIAFSNADGNWFFLGGPSLFYPTGFFPLLFSVGLLIYFVFSISIVKIIDSKSNIIMIQQKFGMAKYTNIPKNNIQEVLLSNKKMNAMYLWIVVLGVPIWFLGADGLTFLTNPHSFGMGITTGLHFIFQAFSLLVGLILLVGIHPIHLQISDLKNRYILRYSLLPNRKNKNRKLWNMFQTEKQKSKQKSEKKFKQKSPKNKSLIDKFSNNCSFEALKKDPRFLFGFLFIILAIVSRIFKIFAGEPLAVTLFLTGIIMFIKSFKEPKGPKEPRINKGNDNFSNNAPSLGIGIFDYLSLGSTIFLSILNTGMMIWTTPASIDSYWIFLLSHILGLSIIFYGITAIIKDRNRKI